MRISLHAIALAGAMLPTACAHERGSKPCQAAWNTPMHARPLTKDDICGLWEAYSPDGDRFYRLEFDGSSGLLAVVMGPREALMAITFQIGRFQLTQEVVLEGAEHPEGRAKFKFVGQGLAFREGVARLSGRFELGGPHTPQKPYWNAETVTFVRQSYPAYLDPFRKRASTELDRMRRGERNKDL